MFCGQCGTNNTPGTRFCTNCGQPLVDPAVTESPTPGAAQAPSAPAGAWPPGPPGAPVGYAPATPGGSPGPAAPNPGHPTAGYPSGPAQTGYTGGYAPAAPHKPGGASIDFRRLGVGDLIAAGATVLLFISLFLTWYSATYAFRLRSYTLSTSALGSASGGFRVIILILAIVVVLYLFARTLAPSGFRLPLPHWQLLTVLVGLQFLVTLLAFLVKPHATVHVSWGFGAFMGLVTAAIAVIGGVVRQNQPEVIVPGVVHVGVGAGQGTAFSSTPQPAPAGGFTPQPGSGGYAQQPGGYSQQPVPGQPPQQKACAHCGAAIPTGAPFCTTCGAPSPV